jgi:hypothetical protein
LVLENRIPQVFRYGQIFGAHDYDGLNGLFIKRRGESRSLSDAHKATFGAFLAVENVDLNAMLAVECPKGSCYAGHRETAGRRSPLTRD